MHSPGNLTDGADFFFFFFGVYVVFSKQEQICLFQTVSSYNSIRLYIILDFFFGGVLVMWGLSILELQPVS